MQFNEFKEYIIKRRNLPKNFFSPNINNVNDIKTLKNAKKAIDKINYYIKNNGSIVVYADVDIDGITAMSIAYKWLKKNHDDVTYIYHEKKQGHGVIQGVVPICDLLIMVDSSSNDTGIIKDLIDSNTIKDCIIIDHHEIENDVIESDNIVLVNPHQSGCRYANKEATGALLTYRIFDALENHYKYPYYINNLMYLASISLVSDSASALNMENRYYFYAGNLFDSPAFKAIDEWKSTYSSEDLSYSFNPLLNAAIREDNMQIAISFILSEDLEEAKNILKMLKDIYENSKEIVAKEMENAIIEFENDNIIVVSTSYQHKGYMAIKFVNMLNKNALVISNTKNSNGVYTGSGRAYGITPLKTLLNDTHLSTIGHTKAFGCSISQSNKDVFFDELKEINFPELVFDYDFEITSDEFNIDEIMFANYCNFFTSDEFKPVLYKISGLLIDSIGHTKSGNIYFTDTNGVRYSQHNNNWLNNWGRDDFVDVIGDIQYQVWFNKEQIIMMVEYIQDCDDNVWS